MNLSEDQKSELEKLAELQFSIEECAIILEIEESEIKNNYKIYQKGQLKASAEVRKAIFDQAKSGSTPAQKQMIELINNNSTKKSKPEESNNFEF